MSQERDGTVRIYTCADHTVARCASTREFFRLKETKDYARPATRHLALWARKRKRGVACHGAHGRCLLSVAGARRQQLLSSTGDGVACSLDTDDDGNYLWVQDHDGDPSTPLTCAGHDGTFDTFGYDAVISLAHALHDLVEVQKRDANVGSELLDTLIKRVRFDGVSGRVEFYDASADPERFGHGDRHMGVSFLLLNYVNQATGFVEAGVWLACSTSSTCSSWSERWQPKAAELIYSTADNSQPRQLSSCQYGQVLTDSGCVCDNGFEWDEMAASCIQCPAGQGSIRATRNESGSAGCTMCAPGYFRAYAHLSASESASKCSPCDEVRGVRCASSNASMATLNLESGYWRHSATTLETWRCRSHGSWTPCHGGADPGHAGGGYCAAGYRGPKCELCNGTSKYSEYFDKLDARCHGCGSAATRPSATFGAIVLIFCLALACSSTAAMSRLLPRQRNALRRIVQTCKRIWIKAGMRFKIKMLIRLYHFIAATPSVFHVDTPDGLRALTGWITILEWPADLSNLVMLRLVSPEVNEGAGTLTAGRHINLI
jgi:hypothetical protein